jgi:hypothetical protein
LNETIAPGVERRILKLIFQLVFFSWVQNPRAESVPDSSRRMDETGPKEVGELEWLL